MVFAAMRYSPPLIAETLEEIRKRGISRIILISLSPYHSSFTTEGYYAEVKRIISLWNDGMKLVEVDNWHAHPVLCAAWAAKITEALVKISARKNEPPRNSTP